MTFPVSHSTLDATALAAEVQRRYGIAGPLRCRLVARGSNDIYLTENGTGQYALRVSRAQHRSGTEIQFETQLLSHLAQLGLPVPTPIALRDGSQSFSVLAPEGERPIVMMSWIAGRPLNRQMSAIEAGKAGELLGQINAAASSFQTPQPKLIDTVARIKRQQQHVDRLLHAGSIERASFDQGLQAVDAAFQSRAMRGLRHGAIHGDFQHANLLQNFDGALTAIDFDDCGTDIIAKDLITFEWRARLDALDAGVIDAFRQAYERVFPLSPQEHAALPVLRIARDLYLLASYAAYIDRIGPVDGFERPERLLALLVEDLKQLSDT
ncbi:MAG: phosphotransferase [Proteobacteria bacterium]|nr:phosphotransferase [Pseudomonadota bacterium]